MNLHFPYPRIFSLIQRAMPQAFGDAANSNTQTELCLQQHCLAKHKNVQYFTVLHNSNQKCGMEKWMTVEISIKLRRKQPASLLTQTALLYKNHTLHKKAQTMTIFHLLWNEQTPKSLNLHHHQNPQISQVSHSLQKSDKAKEKSSIIGNSSNLQDSEQGISLYVCAHVCAHMHTHLL